MCALDHKWLLLVRPPYNLQPAFIPMAVFLRFFQIPVTYLQFYTMTAVRRPAGLEALCVRILLDYLH